jgi:hypothetical protein
MNSSSYLPLQGRSSGRPRARQLGAAGLGPPSPSPSGLPDERRVDSRSLPLEALPGDYVAEHVEAPTLEPDEVDVGAAVVEPERLADKRLAAGLGRLPEVVERLRGLGQRCLGRSREVDAAEEEMAAGGVWFGRAADDAGSVVRQSSAFGAGRRGDESGARCCSGAGGTHLGKRPRTSGHSAPGRAGP